MAHPTFRVFLSHRYKSPEVNKRFFELLTAYGAVQFEVDIGTKPTNFTRLERFVREADAFVGIYPFPGPDDGRPKAATAMRESRYFRLELDLAIRSGRPAIVFLDARYGTAMEIPQSIRQHRYDHHEIQGPGARRKESRLRSLTHDFCADVATMMRVTSNRPQPSSDRVGIVLPRRAEYSKLLIARIDKQLGEISLTPVHLDSRAAIDGKFLSNLETLDWVIVDIGPESCATGLPAFLHGHFVPQMRLMRLPSRKPQARSPLESTLLAGFEVGYPKDIIRWRDRATLEREFRQRLTTLYEPRKYISTTDEAERYFASASLRNEVVFLSYSGVDRDLAAKIRNALKKRFQDVFDYRDQGESIVPGRRWIEEIFDRLASSAIGIPLLSSDYFKSGNCKHEARQMMSQADAGNITIVPIKTGEGSLELPAWMQDIQYIRSWEYPSLERLVDQIVAAYDLTAKSADGRKAKPKADNSRRR
jgi:hypothetical protein